MSTPSIEDVLAKHRYLPGQPFLGLVFPVSCGCGAKTPGWTAYEAHLADAIRAHLAEHTDEAAEAVAELAVIQNLAMEHMNCSGCPTPWWLKQALGGEQ